ncbi:MAG: hypothetical protein B6226_02480 [Candidatus Cloacimonetes bacterium 4572_65]|nr:MAG: hypothetical protein B6226_02480 [Candidatus Cloacimonetes bacterium 4572_65]
MKNIKLFIALTLIALISITSIFAVNNKTKKSGHCAPVCPSTQKVELDEITGTILKTKSNLKVVEDSTKNIINLIFDESMEEKVETIKADAKYIFKGKTVKGGFLVKDFAELTKDVHGYFVIAKKCISCRLCVKNCPVNAIKMVKGKAVIDQDKCIKCGICVNGNGKFKGCPVTAIEKK